MVFAGFLGLWFVFNSKLNLELLLFGLPIALFLTFFTKRFLIKSKKLPLGTVYSYVKYIGLLLREIILANKQVLSFIYSKDRDIVPKLVFLKTKLKKDENRTLFADSITLSPGTITVSLEEDKLVVHCLDEDFEKDIIDSPFEKSLLNIEKAED